MLAMYGASLCTKHSKDPLHQQKKAIIAPHDITIRFRKFKERKSNPIMSTQFSVNFEGSRIHFKKWKFERPPNSKSRVAHVSSPTLIEDEGHPTDISYPSSSPKDENQINTTIQEMQMQHCEVSIDTLTNTTLSAGIPV